MQAPLNCRIMDVIPDLEDRLAEADRIAKRRLGKTDLTDAERLCLQRVRAIITYGAARPSPPAPFPAQGRSWRFFRRIAVQINNQPPRRHRGAAHTIQRLHHQNHSAARHLRRMQSPHTLPTLPHLATTAEQPDTQPARPSALTMAHHLTSTGKAEGQAVSAIPGYPAAARSSRPQRNLATRGSAPR